MKHYYPFLRTLLFSLLITCCGSHVKAQFTAGNLVVVNVNNTNTASLLEYTTSGSLSQTISVPSTGGGALTISFTATSEGALSRSQTGQYLGFTGYRTGTNGSGTDRVIARVGNDAVVNTSSAIPNSEGYTGNNIRGAVFSNDGGRFWTSGTGGGGGTRTNTYGATSGSIQVSTSVTNTRVVNIFNGQLYLASASGTFQGVSSVGTGLPTTTGNTTTILPGFPTTTGPGAYGFAMNTTGNIIYVADDRAVASGGGIQKWTFNGTTWSLAYTLGTGTGSTVGARGLAVDFSGSNPVIYATTAEGSLNRIITITDAGAGSAATTLATSATNNIFRGIAFAPVAPALPTVALSVTSNSSSETSPTAITVTATASAPVSGNQTVDVAISGTNITAGDYNLSGTTITILSGQTTGSVTFTVVDDIVVESTETAVLTISNPSSGITLGSPVTQNITITDNDVVPNPTVDLSVSANAGTEAGFTTITLTATASASVSGNQTVTVNISGTGITASDYILSGATITIPDAQTTGSVTFKIRNDAEIEGTETATATISSPSSGITLGSVTTQNISITDNSCQPLIYKSTGTSSNGAEISAYDTSSKRVFTVAGPAMEYYSLSSTGMLTGPTNMPFGFTAPVNTNVLPNSVAVKNGIVAVSYAVVDNSSAAQQQGIVAFYNAATATYIHHVTVGYLPDMITYTPDGMKLLTANEGEPNSYGQGNSFDPEGSVSIIDISGGVLSATVQTAGFSSFNGQIATLRAAGVRIYGPGATVAQDFEPEYIALSPDASKAYVTLQENNAVAELDIATATITQVFPLGLKNHNLPGNGLDASDRDSTASTGKINIQNWPVLGMYEPDAIARFTVGGNTYYITANEGDTRAYTGFNEEVRVGAGAYVLDPTVFPNAATLKLNQNLGRLQLTNATGDIDNDGDFDEIHALGARSFTIWSSTFTPVFDAGDQLERISAEQNPASFNSDGTPATFDTRSDNKGPEPEAVTVGVVNGVTYAFVGTERTGDIYVYDISNPAAPVFRQYIDNPLDNGVEGLIFIPAAESPTGKALVIATAEVSRTVSVYEFSLVPDALATVNTNLTGAQEATTVYGDCGGLITKLAQNGASPVTGNVNARVWIEGTVPVDGNGNPFVQRHYEITPVTNASAATGRVTLYFTQAEFDNYNNHPGSITDLPTGAGDAPGIANLQVIKYPGTTNDNSGFPGSYTAPAELIDPDDADIVYNAVAGRWEVSFNVTGFSGFIVRTGALIVPVRLISFGANVQNNDALVQWTAENETNHSGYEIQYSQDGRNFISAGSIPAQNGNGTRQYSFTHANAAAIGSKLYYRLKIVSVSGEPAYSHIVLLRFGGKEGITDIYPNPVKSAVNITATVPAGKYISIRIADMNGKTVAAEKLSGNGSHSISLVGAGAGIYVLEAILPDGSRQQFKLVKE